MELIDLVDKYADSVAHPDKYVSGAASSYRFALIRAFANIDAENSKLRGTLDLIKMNAGVPETVWGLAKNALN